MVRTRCRPVFGGTGLAIIGLTALLGVAATVSGASVAAAILLLTAASLGARMLAEAGSAVATMVDAVGSAVPGGEA
jgi:hypothetical protein